VRDTAFDRSRTLSTLSAPLAESSWRPRAKSRPCSSNGTYGATSPIPSLLEPSGTALLCDSM
jgi:hypothetical protein